MTKNGIELSRNDIVETEWKQKSHSKVRINAEKKIMYSGRKKQKGNISYISLTGLKIHIWRKKNKLLLRVHESWLIYSHLVKLASTARAEEEQQKE